VVVHRKRLSLFSEFVPAQHDALLLSIRICMSALYSWRQGRHGHSNHDDALEIRGRTREMSLLFSEFVPAQHDSLLLNIRICMSAPCALGDRESTGVPITTLWKSEETRERPWGNTPALIARASQSSLLSNPMGICVFVFLGERSRCARLLGSCLSFRSVRRLYIGCGCGRDTGTFRMRLSLLFSEFVLAQHGLLLLSIRICMGALYSWRQGESMGIPITTL